MQLEAISYIIVKRRARKKLDYETNLVQNNYLFDLMMYMLAFRLMVGILV